MSIYEIAGKVALQLVPAGMGAVLARSQLGLRDEEDGEEVRRESYGGELFLMAAGALFLAFNVAPTEEIVLIAHQQASPWYGLALLLVLDSIAACLRLRRGLRGPAQSAGGSRPPP